MRLDSFYGNISVLLLLYKCKLTWRRCKFKIDWQQNARSL